MGNQKSYGSPIGQLCDHRQVLPPLNVVKCNMSKVAAENFEVLSNADILSFQFGNRMSYSSSPQNFLSLGTGFMEDRFSHGPGGWGKEMVSG